MSAAVPSVFISHGSPMRALEAGAAGEAWAAASTLARGRRAMDELDFMSVSL